MSKSNTVYAEDVYEEASMAASAAVKNYLETYGEAGFNCGFSSVTINPARGTFVKYLKSISIGRKGYPKGYTVHSPGSSVALFGLIQDMSAKEAGSRAFAEVLRKYGIECSVNSRLD